MGKLTPFILLIVSVGLFFVFIDPQYEKIKELKKEKAENESLLELAEQLQRKREQLHQNFNSISNEDKAQLQKLLPDTVDNVRLILDINNIAETYGIAISDIVVNGDDESEDGSSNTKTAGDIGVINLGFSMTATYDVFIQFLKDLEEALRIVDIRFLTVEAGEEGELFYNYRIELDTYWLR